MKNKTKKKNTTENRVGRPTKYKPEFCEQLVEYMKQGLSFESFAGEIDVSTATLYDWTSEGSDYYKPEFSEAKKRAFAKSMQFWEKKGIEGMFSPNGEEGYSFNASVWIFNMKNRFKWRDKVEHSMDATHPITLAYNPDAEA